MAEYAEQEEPGVKQVWVSLLILFVLTGCEVDSAAKELESTMLVQVLGIDWTEDAVVLTAGSDPGTGSGGTKTPVISAEGENLGKAKKALEGAGEERVSLTHVAQIVLGEGTRLEEVLSAALKDSVLGQGATVWMAQDGTAEELLRAVNGGARRLASIEINSGVRPVTLLQSMMWLEERGWTEVPLLRAEGETMALDGMIRVETEGASGAG